jgi:hypothetical protein
MNTSHYNLNLNTYQQPPTTYNMNTTNTSSTLNINTTYLTQNSLLLNTLLKYYREHHNLEHMLSIINGESKISLRIVDWFVTNYAKKYFTIYTLSNKKRFKVYVDYKLKLRAYTKKRFDPFCRWERVIIPYKENMSVQTTIGQLNFFKWAIENNVIDYIEKHYQEIETDMNTRNSTSKRKSLTSTASSTSSTTSTNSNTNDNNSMLNSNSYISSQPQNKTRKRREELSVCASKSIYKEDVQIVVKFN